MKYKVLVLTLMLWLSACVSVPNEQNVELSAGVLFKLSSPPVDLISKTQTHLIEVQFNDEVSSLIAQVEYAQNQITIAAMSVSGVPLFDFIWHQDKPNEITQYVPLPGIDLNYIIADLQWVNWPIKQLKQSIISDDAIVEQISLLKSGWQRKLMYQDKLIIQIDKKDNQYFLHHKLRDYQITITDLSEG